MYWTLTRGHIAIYLLLLCAYKRPWPCFFDVLASDNDSSHTPTDTERITREAATLSQTTRNDYDVLLLDDCY